MRWLVSPITLSFQFDVCLFMGMRRGLEEVTFHMSLCHGLALPPFAHAQRLASPWPSSSCITGCIAIFFRLCVAFGSFHSPTFLIAGAAA
ncbi:hypothetical protein PSPO01_05222 [Paraphaeosphaeria sporulosa]